MLKKTITYTDYAGVQRTEDHYFNLTKAEITEMDLSTDGGLINYIETIVASRDSKEIISTFKNLIHKSYGVKSLDGRRFVKNQAVLDEFTQTEAYSQLFMELATNAEAAAAFFNGITPSVEPTDHLPSR
jgi:hypothetical protein